jgi:type VI secretion system protein ImpE
MSTTAPQPGEIGAHFQAGRLPEALAAANAALRRAPTDLGTRILLAELLAFSGNAERADVILDAASDIEPAAAVTVAEFRQLLRAEVARRQLFRDGRVPEFLSEPTEAQRHALAALVALRVNDASEAARLSAAAEAARPRSAGTSDGVHFDDFRDADDLLAGSFEVLTTTGKYFWVPVERVASIEFHPPKRARDLLWRRASMSVNDGPDGDVYIPCTYPPPEGTTDSALLLGRATDWSGPESGPVRGVGLRTFLVGDGDATIMQLKALTFGAGG